MHLHCYMGSRLSGGELMYSKLFTAMVIAIVTVFVASVALITTNVNTNTHTTSTFITQLHKSSTYFFDGGNNTQNLSNNNTVQPPPSTLNQTSQTNTTSQNTANNNSTNSTPPSAVPSNSIPSNATSSNSTSSNSISSNSIPPNNPIPTNQTNNTTNNTTNTPPPAPTPQTPSAPLTIQNPYAIINSTPQTVANVTQGDAITITIYDNGASGGTSPYTYQWLETYSNSQVPTNVTPADTATDCGAGNSQQAPPTGNVIPCVVNTTLDKLNGGTYNFQLMATDATGNYIIDTGFVIHVSTTLNLTEQLITGPTYSNATGQVSGGSGKYNINWYLNGTLPNGTTTCTYDKRVSGTQGENSFVFLIGDGHYYNS
ncbi:MAG: hypothetical protein ACHQX1_00980, partial [Candidatus Micrarchaeales archaeon]